MTTLEQKQQSAIDLAENWAAHCEEPIKYGFIAGAEWAESQTRWIPGSEGPPLTGGIDTSHISCWIVRKGSSWYQRAEWNKHHEVWDKEDMDDELCEHEDVAFYLPIKLPPIPPAQEGEQK